MSDGPVCKTCDEGRLQLVMRRRHGWLASFFGAVLVVASIASLVVWVFGFLDALARRELLGDIRVILLICGWFLSSVLLGIFGALASRKESLLACTNCFAITRALSKDEAEESALAGKVIAATESRAGA